MIFLKTKKTQKWKLSRKNPTTGNSRGSDWY